MNKPGTPNQRLVEECRQLLSHEMRSPLMVLEGFTQQLLDRHAEQIDEKGVRYLNRMLGATRHLSSQVDGVLALIEIARQPIRIERVDVTALCRELCDERRAANPGRDVQVDIEEGMSCETDAALLRIVWSHLLDNAWKFTARTDMPHIGMGSKPPQDEDGSHVFFIRDNGAGFDPGRGHKLFQAFSKLHPVTEFEGLGLGLAAARHAVERLDGRIWADGEPGVGCVVRFMLPG